MANTSKHKGCTNGCTCGSPGGCDRYHCLFCNGVPSKFVLDGTEEFVFGVTLTSGTWNNNFTDWVKNPNLPSISDPVCTAMWKLRTTVDTVITGYKFTTQPLATLSQGNVNYDSGKVTVVFRHDVYEEAGGGAYTLIGYIVFTRIFDADYPCDCLDEKAQVEIPVLSTVWQIYDAAFLLITSGALFDEINGIKSNVPYQFADCQHHNLSVTTGVCPLCMPATWQEIPGAGEATCKCFDADGCAQDVGPARTVTISVFGASTDYVMECGDAAIGPVLIDNNAVTGATVHATMSYWVTTIESKIDLPNPGPATRRLSKTVNLNSALDSVSLPAFFDQNGNQCGYPDVIVRDSCDQTTQLSIGQCIQQNLPIVDAGTSISCTTAAADGLIGALNLEDYILGWDF